MARKQQQPIIASVHRFRDKVAVFVGNGETTYLTVSQARKLAAAVDACARDIEFGPEFSKSTLAPENVPHDGDAS